MLSRILLMLPRTGLAGMDRSQGLWLAGVPPRPLLRPALLGLASQGGAAEHTVTTSRWQTPPQQATDEVQPPNPHPHAGLSKQSLSHRPQWLRWVKVLTHWLLQFIRPVA